MSLGSPTLISHIINDIVVNEPMENDDYMSYNVRK